MKNFKRTIALPGGSRAASPAVRPVNSRFEWLAWSMADNAESKIFLEALRVLDCSGAAAPGTGEEKAFIVAYRFLANALEKGTIPAAGFAEWLAAMAEHFFKFNCSSYICSACYALAGFKSCLIKKRAFPDALGRVIAAEGEAGYAAAVCHYILGRGCYIDFPAGDGALYHYKKALEILNAGEFPIDSKLWFDLQYNCAIAAVAKGGIDEAADIVAGAIADIDLALNEDRMLRASSGSIAAAGGRNERPEMLRRIMFKGFSPGYETARFRAAEALLVYHKTKFSYYDEVVELLRGALMALLRNFAPSDDPAPVIELYFKLFRISVRSGVVEKAREYLKEAERLIEESIGACETAINFYYAVAEEYQDGQQLPAYFETLEKLMDIGAALYGEHGYYFWQFTNQGMLISLVNEDHGKGLYFYGMREAARADAQTRFGAERDYVRNMAGELYFMAGDLEKAECEFALVASAGGDCAREAESFLKKIRAAKALRERADGENSVKRSA